MQALVQQEAQPPAGHQHRPHLPGHGERGPRPVSAAEEYEDAWHYASHFRHVYKPREGNFTILFVTTKDDYLTAMIRLCSLPCLPPRPGEEPSVRCLVVLRGLRSQGLLRPGGGAHGPSTSYDHCLGPWL